MVNWPKKQRVNFAHLYMFNSLSLDFINKTENVFKKKNRRRNNDLVFGRTIGDKKRVVARPIRACIKFISGLV